MSLDYTLGFVDGMILATVLFTLGQDLILKLLKKEVKIIDKSPRGQAI